MRDLKWRNNRSNVITVDNHFLVGGMGMEDEKYGYRKVPDFNPHDFF